ncbi:MAG: SRPBCC family protein [Planctomycetota bacterium]
MSEPEAEAPPSSPEAPQGAAAPRQDALGKRIAQLMGGALVATLLAGVALWVRGSHAASQALAPQSAAEGTSHQLLQDGPRTLIQAALVVDRPLSEVWAVVTDYEHFGEIFQPPLWTLDVEPVAVADAAQPKDCRLRGEARSRLWRVPVDVLVKHTVDAQGVHRASWDCAPAAGCNRGAWTLTPLDGQRTQLRYEAEIDVPPYPRFMVHNLLLSEVDFVVDAVRDRAGRAPSAPR